MTKRFFRWVTLTLIWTLLIVRIVPSASIFWANCLDLFDAFPDFRFLFSLSHFLDFSAFAAFFYFIYYLISYFDERNEVKSLFIRYRNTLYDYDSIILKIVLIVSPITILLFIVRIAGWNLPQTPEILIVPFVFTIIEFLKICKKESSEEGAIAQNTGCYLFADIPVRKYMDLSEYQKNEVNKLRNILGICSKEEYLSVALNGSWGSGKTSILMGLKDLIQNHDEIIRRLDNHNLGNARGLVKEADSKKYDRKYEIIELNLWQLRTPENVVLELERLFEELFNKVYLDVSARDLAFFSLLAGSGNSWLCEPFMKLIGRESSSLPVTKERLEKGLCKVLARLHVEKLVILIDDLDRTPEQYLNGFLKIICYVMGLRNVVTISGINKKQILLQLQPPNEIPVWADGVDMNEKLRKQRSIEQEKKNTNVFERSNIKDSDPVEKREFKFPQFDNESFLSKIFSVQLELIGSEYHLKEFADNQQDKLDLFRNEISFIDKEHIIEGIRKFIAGNISYFNSYRDIKLFFNEVFIYLIGFGGDKQNKIQLSDYIDIKSVLAMAWAKVVCPDFYKEVQDYVTPFIYRSKNLSAESTWKEGFNLKEFVTKQYSCFDDGKELVINTKAHRQIKIVFDQIEEENSLFNADAAMKYFHPVIHPYEFNTVEFTNLFNPKDLDVNLLKDAMQVKCESNPISFATSFINRLTLRKFDPAERLYSSLALVDLVSREVGTPHEKYKLWGNISILFRYDREESKFISIRQLFSIEELIQSVFNLWEKMTDLEIYEKQIADTQYGSGNFNSLFYDFFNPSNFNDDDGAEIGANYEFLIQETESHAFLKKENKIACLEYIFNLSERNWFGANKDYSRALEFEEVVPLFLKSFLSHVESPLPKTQFGATDLINYSIERYNYDHILFGSENILKVILVIKERSKFTSFINLLSRRNGPVQGLNDTEKVTAYQGITSVFNPNSNSQEVLKGFFQQSK